MAVGAVDPYGNVDPTFNGPVTVGLASGSAGSLGGTLTQTAVNGVATFDDLTDTTSGSITLTGTSGTLTTGSSGNNTVPIDPAAVDHFTVTTTFATPDVAGTAGTVTVAAYDQYGNLENSGTNPYEGTVDLVSSDGQTTGLPATYAFTAARRRIAHVRWRRPRDGGEPVDHRHRLRRPARSPGPAPTSRSSRRRPARC